MESPDSSSTQMIDNVLPDNKFGPHVLPPCRVCGAQATGYHYGANTCEACKGFFHRSLNKKEQYICLQNEKCELKPGNRSLCPYCRYQRCIEVGMSKGSIKTGRYSYAKRTRDILELKAIRLQKKQDLTPVIIKTEPHTLFKPEQLKAIHYTIQKLREARDRFVMSQISTSNNVQANLLQKKLGCQLDSGVLQAIQTPSTSAIQFASFKPTISTNDIIASSENVEEEESDAIKTWVNVVAGQSGPITSMVNFIKGLPGFTKLPMIDQIQLIKYSIMEVWLIARYPMFDLETKKFTSASGFTFDLNKAIGSELAELMCYNANKLQNLQLDKEIIFIIAAFVVVSPDRCDLQTPEETSNLQKTMLDTLLFVLHQKYQGAYLQQFAKIIIVLTELRNVTEQYLKTTDTFITKMSDIPPLLSEILTLS